MLPAPCPLLPTPQPSSPSHSATPSLWLQALNLSLGAPFTGTGLSCQPPDHATLHYLGLQQQLPDFSPSLNSTQHPTGSATTRS